MNNTPPEGYQTDPAGNSLWIATRKETLTSEELQRRARENWS